MFRTTPVLLTLLFASYTPAQRDGDRPVNQLNKTPPTPVKLTGVLPLKHDGKLTAFDPIYPRVKNPHHSLEIPLKKGVGYVFTATSEAFDTILFLANADGKLLNFDDDGGGGTNSRLAYTPEEDGTYRLLIATFDGKLGAFSLGVRLQNGEETELDLAKKLEDEGIRFLETGKFAEGETSYRKAAELRLKHQGEASPWTLFAQHQLAFALTGQKKYAEAEAIDRKVLEQRRKILGPLHRETIRSLHCLAYGLGRLFRHAEAEAAWREVVDLLSKSLGPEHPDTLAALHNLAWCLGLDQGKHADAEPVNRKAYELRKKVLGPDHLLTASSLNNLALDLRFLDRYAEAEALHRQVLALYLRTLGKEHRLTANALHNLAIDLNSQGLYAEAEMFIRQAVLIARKVLGPDHEDFAAPLASLGINLGNQGRFAEAEESQREVVALRRRVFGPDHPTYAVALSHLSVALANLDRREEALPLSRESVAIFRKHLGDEHPNTIIEIINLAILLDKTGNHEDAERLHRQGLEQCIKLFGEDSLKTATSLNNVAFSIGYADNFEEADKLFRRALGIREKILGRNHFQTAMLNRTYAHFLYHFGKFEDAEPLALAGVEGFERSRLGSSFSGLGRVTLSKSSTPYHPLAAATLIRNGKGQQAWELLERHRARGLMDSLASRAQRPLTVEERQREEEIHRRLSNLGRLSRDLESAKNPSASELARLRSEREDAVTELTQLEADFARKYGPSAGQIYDRVKLQTMLEPDTAFITWLVMNGSKKGTQPGGDHWAALLRQTGDPIWVKLSGSGENGAWLPSDSALLDQVRKELQSPNPSTDPVALFAKLARQRLGPLEPHLKGVRKLVVLPSLAMTNIPLEALTDRFQISYAPSATVFTWLRENKKDSAKDNLLALGDPTFPAAPTKGATSDLLKVMRGLSPKPLPCTRSEVEAIAKLMNAHGGKSATLLGLDATEKGLETLLAKENLANFRYLHLATHGHPNAAQGFNSYLALTSENPDEIPEGRLTAEQILRTWKLNADLVTLSACSSGLGQETGGDHYVGFAQALFLAGARSLVLSQWQVSDHATALLMVRFYRNLLGQRDGLSGPMSKLDSLGEARNWLKTLKHDDVARLVRELPDGAREIARWDDDEHPYAHPNYWAAFILIGDPG